MLIEAAVHALGLAIGVRLGFNCRNWDKSRLLVAASVALFCSIGKESDGVITCCMQ